MTKIKEMEFTVAETFLIAIHRTDKSGFDDMGANINLGLLGGMFLDLFNNEELMLSNKIVICKNRNLSESVHPSLLSLILKSKKERKLQQWFQRLNVKTNKLKKDVVRRLADQRILKVERKKFLGIFPYTTTYLRDKSYQRALIQELKMDVRSGMQISAKNLSVLGLIEATRLHRVLAKDRHERKQLAKKMKALREGSLVNKHIEETIIQTQLIIQAAVMAAVITVPVHHS